MKDVFWGDERSISATRFMLLVGRVEEVLGEWSGEMVRDGEGKSTRRNLVWIGADGIVEMFVPVTYRAKSSELVQETSLLPSNRSPIHHNNSPPQPSYTNPTFNLTVSQITTCSIPSQCPQDLMSQNMSVILGPASTSLPSMRSHLRFPR